jgi:hypothetical protein
MQPFRKTFDIRVTETGESVTPGKMGTRKRWDSQRAASSLHHYGRNGYGSQAISYGLTELSRAHPPRPVFSSIPVDAANSVLGW